MLENVVDPITYPKYIKNKAYQFKIQTSTARTYDKYSELLISAATTCNKTFKRVTKFGYKSWRSVYHIEQLPNDRDKDSFYIYSSVDMIQACASQKR